MILNRSVVHRTAIPDYSKTVKESQQCIYPNNVHNVTLLFLKRNEQTSSVANLVPLPIITYDMVEDTVNLLESVNDAENLKVVPIEDSVLVDATEMEDHQVILSELV